MPIILQVNISRGGMPKRPIPGAPIHRLGLEGDSVAHPQFHGGPFQAVLVICAEVVDDLIARGYPIYYGALGENLTVRGLNHRELRAGQRYRAGSAVLELTKVRVPCTQLNVYGKGIHEEIYDREVKAGNTSSPRWAMSGFYASVEYPGEVRPGNPFELLDVAV